jgi:uncharacterized repeat protein (TIGR03803 family)
VSTLQERGGFRDVRRRRGDALLTFAVALLLSLIAALSAQAQTFTVLYSFKGEAAGDGDRPYGSLVQDGAGNLYGTTFYGGIGSSPGNGTVFELDTSGNERVLYRFGSHSGDGTNPYGGLVRDAAGDLYGTTAAGGAFGFGTVFKLNVHGMTVLYSFAGKPDGRLPGATLFRLPNPSGILYGTTVFGGVDDYGTVFSLDTSGKETVLHSFTGGDGGGPGYDLGALIKAPGQGTLHLYGTTRGSSTYSPPPTGSGTVYEIASTGTTRVLHRFTGGTDGSGPSGGLILDTAGNLYGMTALGGAVNGACGPPSPGCGLLFKIDTGGNYAVVHNFTEGENLAISGSTLVLDATGNLYGIAPGCCGFEDFGLIFKLDTFGNYTVAHKLTGADGSYPSGLLFGGDGNLYGTAILGGAFNVGVVFKLTL